MKKFKAPKKSLGNLDAESAAELLTAATDVALIIDRKGVVRDVAFGSDDLLKDVRGDWLNSSWEETVTVESRAKIKAMLEDADTAGDPRWRQVNHPAKSGPDVPILYRARRVGADKRIVALGRDLRGIETLQQRLMEAEQSMEREYSRMRHAETRYRLLFQIASEAVLIVDADSRKVVDANPAALQILGSASRRLVGRTFPEGFDAAGQRAVEALLAGVLATGRAEDAHATLRSTEREFLVSASLFRQNESSHFLVQIRPVGAEASVSEPSIAQTTMLEVLESSPDGLVITNVEGDVLTANRAFLDLAQLATAEQVRDKPLDRWLGRPGVDVRVLVGNLRQHGSVRLFATTMRGEYGSSTDVEVSAVSVANADPQCLGFTVRNIAKRATGDVRNGRELPRTAAELTELIGRVSLKDLVRETTDVIERLCIEAALEITGDNRATAAEMLGLSRQSLYAKLRRYGMGDLADDD
ncbi:MAG: transcriptional regulator PpsR [Proteobacteria bacterium]|nr:transcriptional regulator PpsR [Pseudomonadota bacterium]